MNLAPDRQFELSWDVSEDLMPTVAPLTAHGGSTAILVIDDDVLFAELFVEYARRLGHFAAYYTDLNEFGSLSKLQHYHGALVDYDLGPRLSGLRIAEMFKRYDQRFPVVLTSATRVGQQNCFSQLSDIEGFVRKQEGLASILNRVISIVKSSPNS